MRKLVHTVIQADVGKSYHQKPDCQCCGARGDTIYFGDIVGRFQQCDVGKRIYSVDGVLQIENDQQLKARLEKGE